MNKSIKRKIKYGLRFLPDKLYLQFFYFFTFKRFINFSNPKSFNEKLQWLKFYDRKDEYTVMVDKYEVKEYVANIIGKEYIIPTLSIYNSFDEIEFEKLSNQFVIKCTHDSDGTVIVNDKKKLNIDETKIKINNSLKRNYYYSGREWPYKNVKPRIIVEKYMGDNLSDYKIHCFNGKARFILVCSDRKKQLKDTFFDTNWMLLPFKRPNHNIDKSIEKPKNLSLMIKLAEKLSKNIPFLRVDFYEIHGKIYFGELTFFPANGFGKFEPKKWDYVIGDYLELPNKEN